MASCNTMSNDSSVTSSCDPSQNGPQKKHSWSRRFFSPFKKRKTSQEEFVRQEIVKVIIINSFIHSKLIVHVEWKPFERSVYNCRTHNERVRWVWYIASWFTKKPIGLFLENVHISILPVLQSIFRPTFYVFSKQSPTELQKIRTFSHF